MRASVAAGLAICCFSGDKLLGGPQAGIIVGRQPLVDAIRRHPLMRALRVDKLTYAALDATLAEYAAGRGGAVPIQRMLTTGAEAIRARAEALAAVIRKAAGWKADVVRGMSAVGGGSAPGSNCRRGSSCSRRDGVSAAALEDTLRAAATPVIARIEQDHVVLDLRTVFPEDDESIATITQ